MLVKLLVLSFVFGACPVALAYASWAVRPIPSARVGSLSRWSMYRVLRTAELVLAGGVALGWPVSFAWSVPLWLPVAVNALLIGTCFYGLIHQSVYRAIEESQGRRKAGDARPISLASDPLRDAEFDR